MAGQGMLGKNIEKRYFCFHRLTCIRRGDVSPWGTPGRFEPREKNPEELIGVGIIIGGGDIIPGWGDITPRKQEVYLYLLFYVTFKSPGLKDTMPRIQEIYLLSYVTFKSGWGDFTPENQKAYLLFYVTVKSPGLKNIMPWM